MKEHEFKVAVDALKQKYSYMFADNSLIRHGFSIGPGWLYLFDEMCGDIDAILTDDEKKRFRWSQVKEKFASMRASFKWISNVELPFDPEGYFHPMWSHEDDIAEAYRLGYTKVSEETNTRVINLIRDYEVHAGKTCEICAAKGETYTIGSWITTRCEEHATAAAKWFDDSKVYPHDLKRQVKKTNLTWKTVDIDALLQQQSVSEGGEV